MNNRIIERCFIVALLVTLPLAVAGGLSEPRLGDVVLDDELELAMETVNKSIKSLKKTIAKEDQGAAVLKTIGSLQAALVAAKGQVPPKAADIPAAARGKFMTAYRAMLIEVLQKTLAMEQAVNSGDRAGAAKLLKEVASYKKKGHDKFD